MKKRILFLGVLIIMALSSMLCGCQTKHGEFYSLQAAYDNGLLTKDDLEQIAYYVNGSIKFPETIDSKIEKKIKNDAAYDMRHRTEHPINKAKAEDFFIIKYFGVYSDCYVIKIGNQYEAYPAMPVEKWIEVGGVSISVGGDEPIEIWKEI